MIMLYITKNNRNSIYALLGALEVNNFFLGKDVFIFSRETKMPPENKRHFFLFSFATKDAEQNFKKLKTLKKIYKNSFFICGGPHPSGNPYDCLNNGFNLVIKGECEEIIKDILNFNNNDKKILCQKFSTDINKYHPFPFKNPHYSLYIEITRGCPFNCFFCQTTKIFGSKPRHRSIENILRYCKILLKNNLTDLRFLSPNAFSYGSDTGLDINYDKLHLLFKSLYSLAKGKGRIFFGSFPSEVRPEFINDDTIALIKNYCSNKNIMIGAQSGSEKVLQKLNRKHTVKDIIKGVETFLKYNLLPNIDIISGFPFETIKDIKETITLCQNLINMGCKIHIHKFTPLPDTVFENLSPSEFHPDFKNFINKWIGKGMVWGKVL